MELNTISLCIEKTFFYARTEKKHELYENYRGRRESTHTFRHNLSVSIKLRAGEEFLTLRLICRLGAIVRG